MSSKVKNTVGLGCQVLKFLTEPFVSGFSSRSFLPFPSGLQQLELM